MKPPDGRPVFELTIKPTSEDIDELGHVNNAVYVRWLQQIATAHWLAVGNPNDITQYLWVAVRHEIDYLRPILPDEQIMARTWVGDVPQGARFDRFIILIDAQDKIRAQAKTTWAIVKRENMRPVRISPALAAPFLGTAS